jgi:hypothetical protein
MKPSKVSKRVFSSNVINSSSSAVLSSNLMKLNSDLLLGIVYIPPEYSRYSSPDAFSQIENEYLEFTEKIKNICLIGDCNARTAEDDEFITLDENSLFETFDDFIENAPNVL